MGGSFLASVIANTFEGEVFDHYELKEFDKGFIGKVTLFYSRPVWRNPHDEHTIRTHLHELSTILTMCLKNSHSFF
jgi:hypothetical protein